MHPNVTMTPEELRADVPALQDGAYFNFGAHGPSPEYVVDAADEFVRSHEYDAPIADDPYETAFRAFDRTRETVASFVGAEPDEIALTESTTAGINAIAGAIDWQPGDVVVRTDLEHPAGILPWQRLEREGVEVRVVETDAGRVDPDRFAEAVSDARLACFSAVTWTHGTRLPVTELVDIAHDAGALALVDAVQVPGQFPMDVGEWGADAVAAAGHKWLLGLWGGGFLYVDRDVAAGLEPRAVGYRSVETPTADPYEYAAGARRFEIGSANPGPHVALREAIDAIDEVGIDRIEERVRRLAGRLADGVPDDRLYSPAEPESGLVAIDVDDPAATVERLADDGIVLRKLPSPNAIRASVHAVNTATEVDRLLERLEREW
ncbi:aminotransferase class V-fold PLP-dependent enzyme [Natrinema sp. 1APR25-10V2]|uniref:aminotransferase class V-fold PLP-dependent enzyme n=1 Tax=Natrinema sp. 1APR25-10V2 TaxID=2951081 RepID=UPI0028742654|nr:aminotransferase class V-fold PLP-dependent enzyme [Natrinema sp. 1APR25-10V2]MDS0473373.1 aminotransferase class V-fold PLP-dependent enzyme [Natrinema sp. 1APR25-10V2]